MNADQSSIHSLIRNTFQLIFIDTLDIKSEFSIFMLICDKEYFIDPEQTVKKSFYSEFV